MKKLTTFTAIIAAILIFSSCTKIKPNKNIYTSNNNHNSTKISSGQNAFNFVGEIHNEVLKEAFISSEFMGLSKHDKVLWIYNKTNNALIGRGLDNYIVLNANQYLSNDLLASLPDQSTNPENYFNQKISILSETEQAYIQNMLTEFTNYGTHKNKTQLESNISTILCNINQNQGITEDRKKLLSGCLSIGLSSFNFWNSDLAPKAKIKPWLADIGGFIVGAGVTIWGIANYPNNDLWGNPITNGIATATFASTTAEE
jgi:hypothetical protein